MSNQIKDLTPKQISNCLKRAEEQVQAEKARQWENLKALADRGTIFLVGYSKPKNES